MVGSIWVDQRCLRQYDSTKDYLPAYQQPEYPDPRPTDSEEVKDEKLRVIAFKQDATWDCPGHEQEKHMYWKNIIEKQKEERRLVKDLEKKRSRGRSPAKRSSKRQRTTNKVAAGTGYDTSRLPEAATPPKPGNSFILVGRRKQKSFEIPHHALMACNYFAGGVRPNGTMPTQFDLRDMNDITAKTFDPVAAWLSGQDFEPTTSTANDGKLQFQQVSASNAAQKDRASHQIASVYLVAAQLQCNVLMLQCAVKLSLLHGLSPAAIMFVLRCFNKVGKVGSKAEQQVEDWLMVQLILNFWALMREQGAALAEGLEGNEYLRKGVLGAMADR